MNDLEQPILQVLDHYKAAVFAKDVDTFVALYDQDIHVFDMWKEWAYRGLEAWHGVVVNWFGSLGSERVVVEMQDVQTMISQELAVAHAFVSYKAVSAEGQTLRSMQNRLTITLKYTGDAWKIIHQHSSAPINLETAKVILQR